MPKATLAPRKPKDDSEADEAPAPAAKTAKAAPKAPRRAAALTSLASLEDSREFTNALWWGREGSGKTTDLLTAANYGKVVLIDAEGGAKKKPLRDFGIALTNIIPWPGKGGEITFQALEDLSWELSGALADDPNAYFAVIWDSGSEIYDILVANERVNQFDKNETRQGTSNYKEYREDPSFTDIADYGVATTQYKILLRRFRDLPCHFLVSALERRDVDEDTSKVMYGPAVGPSAQTAMLGLMDLVIYTRAGALQTGEDPEVDVKDEFYGLARQATLQRAKDRFRALPRNLSTPTFERVQQYINEELIEDDDIIQKQWVADRKISAELAEARKAARKAASRAR